VEEVENSIPSDVHFIGGHPMAGTEHQGIRAANQFLFEGANYILTPTSKTDAQALIELKSFIEKLDVNLFLIPPDKHDLVVAGISHMPLAIAVSLVNTIADMGEERENMLKVTASGFRDTTRIAAGNVEMGKDMFISNRTAVLAMIRHFKKSLDKMETLIKEGDIEKITAELERAKKLRTEMYAAEN
jgi:prephenate dehydrogenase